LSRKKSCSPAVKMNSPPQSAQVRSLSTNSIPHLPSSGKTDTSKYRNFADDDWSNFGQFGTGAHVAGSRHHGLPVIRLKSKRLPAPADPGRWGLRQI
jgi:hypothetical protein